MQKEREEETRLWFPILISGMAGQFFLIWSCLSIKIVQSNMVCWSYVYLKQSLVVTHMYILSVHTCFLHVIMVDKQWQIQQGVFRANSLSRPPCRGAMLF